MDKTKDEKWCKAGKRICENKNEFHDDYCMIHGGSPGVYMKKFTRCPYPIQQWVSDETRARLGMKLNGK